MKPNRIILIRHGESVGNVDFGIYETTPDYKLNLTEKGYEQARLCGRDLKEIVKNESCFFYVSPFWRTRQTFKEITMSFEEDKYSSIEEPRLREQEWGHLRKKDDNSEIIIERDNYGSFYYRIPDGESGADVYDRLSDFFGSLHRDFEKKNFPDNCVIVSHGMTIRLFLMKWFHWTVEEFENLRNLKNCQTVILEKDSRDKYNLITELEVSSD